MKFQYTFPPMEEKKLSNGLTLIVVPDHEQDGIVVALQLPIGRFSDPAGKEGVCELTVGLISKGTESFSSDEFASRLENAGATLFSDVGEEHCVYGIRMLASSAQAIFPIFVEMFSRPRFAAEEFQRLQREMVTALQAERIEPSVLATRHFYHELAGKGHPAGRFQTEQTIKKITLADVKAFFGEYCSPEGGLCVVAGDFNADPFGRFATEQLTFWKRSGRKPQVIAPAAQHPAAAVVRLVNKPDLTQTSLAVGQASPGERCPDKNTLLLANHIFGGGNFSSRLMTRIRTSDGKTYGISSQMVSETEFGALLISTSTQNSQLGGVLGSIIEEYRRFCAEGVTADELEKASQFAIGNMAFQLEGIGNIVDKLLWLRFYGRANSYIERFEDIITAIDIESVNTAVRRYFSPDRLIIAAVGKKEAILPQLSSFGPLKQYHFRDTL